jgi:hypothetical protein
MPVIYPKFIPVKEIQIHPLQYDWDDWDPYRLLGKNDVEVEMFLSTVTHNCKLSYSLGCAEWVLARYSEHKKSQEARRYLDACWAYSITNNFVLPEELDDEFWEGRVLGPICLSLTTVINTFYGMDEDNAEIDSAFAEKIALHILPETDSFIRWRKAIFNRMREFFSIRSDELIGSVLPRDFLNPSIPFQVSKLSQMIESTYKELQIVGNEYLMSINDEDS